MELEITSLEELDPSRIYHIALPPDATPDVIQRMTLAIQNLGLRALITRSGIKFQAFEKMFEELPDESKTRLLEILTVRAKFEIE